MSAERGVSEYRLANTSYEAERDGSAACALSRPAPGGRGTIAIWVSLILDQLAGGTTVEELLPDYPQLKREDVLAAIAYGAEVSRERIIPVPTA